MGNLARKLPAGATGFDTAARLDLDAGERNFVTLCHHAARQIGGTVVDQRRAGVTPNFHEAVVRCAGQEQVAVLRHGLLTLLAFARPRSPDEGAIAFTDHPDLSASISELSDLHIATAAELSTPLSGVDLTDLSEAERRQITYWNPATVGELLFNFWD